MTISNFHTHTRLCHHASGVPADYIAQAVKDGCSELGFSDHCPYPPDMDDYWPNVRMTPDDAPGYIASIRSAAEGIPFKIHAGFECEWDSAYESWYRDTLLGEFGADYLILGSHWMVQGKRHIYAQDITETALLHNYIDQTIKGMESGLYKFIAHPDLFMGGWKEWDSEAASCSNTLLDAAAECNMPVEVNGLGISRGFMETKRGMRYHYPYDEFWQLAAEKGVKVICNADAHNPCDVIASAVKSREYAAKFGITPVETIF